MSILFTNYKLDSDWAYNNFTYLFPTNIIVNFAFNYYYYLKKNRNLCLPYYHYLIVNYHFAYYYLNNYRINLGAFIIINLIKNLINLNSINGINYFITNSKITLFIIIKFIMIIIIN